MAIGQATIAAIHEQVAALAPEARPLVVVNPDASRPTAFVVVDEAAGRWQAWVRFPADGHLLLVEGPLPA